MLVYRDDFDRLGDFNAAAYKGEVLIKWQVVKLKSNQ